MDGVPSNHRLAERKLIALVHDGQWEVDAQGRVWRLAMRTGLKNGGSHVVSVARRRAEHRVPAGYLQVRAMLDGVRVHGLAHRLVWQHLYGDVPPGLEVNHKNTIKDDNRPENLELSSRSENTRHAHRSGMIDQSGEKNHRAKLTNRQVAQIRSAYAQGGYTQQELADRFGVKHQAVSKIVRGDRRPKEAGPVSAEDHRHIASERDPVTGRFIAAEDAEEWPDHLLAATSGGFL